MVLPLLMRVVVVAAQAHLVPIDLEQVQPALKEKAAMDFPIP